MQKYEVNSQFFDPYIKANVTTYLYNRARLFFCLSDGSSEENFLPNRYESCDLHSAYWQTEQNGVT